MKFSYLSTKILLIVVHVIVHNINNSIKNYYYIYIYYLLVISCFIFNMEIARQGKFFTFNSFIKQYIFYIFTAGQNKFFTFEISLLYNLQVGRANCSLSNFIKQYVLQFAWKLLNGAHSSLSVKQYT